MKRKITSLALIALLITGSVMQMACGKKTTTHNLAIYTAQADAALVAFTDTAARLVTAGRLAPASAKSIYTINLRVAGSIDILRERAKTGFDKKDTLVIVDNLIADIRAAEATGVVGLSGETKARFLQVTFFAQFTIRSIKAIVEASKPPAVPAGEVRAAASGASAKAQGEETVWTDIVLILQTAVLRGISQSRMTQDEAFADGATLSGELKKSLAEKLGA